MEQIGDLKAFPSRHKNQPVVEVLEISIGNIGVTLAVTGVLNLSISHILYPRTILCSPTCLIMTSKSHVI